MLATAKQDTGESVDEFTLRINKLTQNCDFTAVSAQEYKDDMKETLLQTDFLQTLLESGYLKTGLQHLQKLMKKLVQLNW